MYFQSGLVIPANYELCVRFFFLVVFPMTLSSLGHKYHGQHSKYNGLDETNKEFQP
jgi:hypothetical protein